MFLSNIKFLQFILLHSLLHLFIIVILHICTILWLEYVIKTFET